jgi:hypothetical protein
MSQKAQEEKIKSLMGGQEEQQDESVLNPEQSMGEGLSRKERRLREKEKIKGMGMKKKWTYFKMYYKWVPVSIVIGIALIYSGISWYHNFKMQTILSIAMVDSADCDTETVAEQVKALLGSDDEYEQVSLLSNLFTSSDDDGGFEYNSQMAFTAQAAANAIDVILMPETIYQNLTADETFLPLDTYLDEQTIEAFGDAALEDCLVLENNSTLQEEFGLYYEPVYVAVLYASDNRENAAAWIATLAE